jgi:hypothetical protein
MRKTKRLTINVLPSDKMMLERIAQTDGEAVAVVVRRLIRKEASARGITVNAVDRAPQQSAPVSTGA